MDTCSSVDRFGSPLRKKRRPILRNPTGRVATLLWSPSSTPSLECLNLLLHCAPPEATRPLPQLAGEGVNVPVPD